MLPGDSPGLVVEGAHYATIAAGSKQIHLPHQRKWHNFLSPFDVNRDGNVTPTDVLTAVNFLNLQAAGSSQVEFIPGELPLMVDVNGDGNASPVDVLQAVNELNRLANGEGEASVLAVPAPLFPDRPLRDSQDGQHFTWSETPSLARRQPVLADDWPWRLGRDPLDESANDKDRRTHQGRFASDVDDLLAAWDAFAE